MVMLKLVGSASSQVTVNRKETMRAVLFTRYQPLAKHRLIGDEHLQLDCERNGGWLMAWAQWLWTVAQPNGRFTIIAMRFVRSVTLRTADVIPANHGNLRKKQSV
jgi:hypothetical protein